MLSEDSSLLSGSVSYSRAILSQTFCKAQRCGHATAAESGYVLPVKENHCDKCRVTAFISQYKGYVGLRRIYIHCPYRSSLSEILIARPTILFPWHPLCTHINPATPQGPVPTLNIRRTRNIRCDKYCRIYCHALSAGYRYILLTLQPWPEALS
jgi:hypothetical protein